MRKDVRLYVKDETRWGSRYIFSKKKRKKNFFFSVDVVQSGTKVEVCFHWEAAHPHHTSERTGPQFTSQMTNRPYKEPAERNKLIGAAGQQRCTRKTLQTRALERPQQQTSARDLINKTIVSASFFTLTPPYPPPTICHGYKTGHPAERPNALVISFV